MKRISSVVLSLVCLIFSLTTSAQQAKRPFTVADDIGLTTFDGQGLIYPADIQFSPDGKYVAVWTERGRLELNQVEDSLRFYRTHDIEEFLKNNKSAAPQPAWVLALQGKYYPVIRKWNWLADSSGVALLRYDAAKATQQVLLADFKKKTIEPLTPANELVRAFDVRDRLHYVYIVSDHSKLDKQLQEQSNATAFSGAGLKPTDLFFGDDPIFRAWRDSDKTLWAVVDGKRFEVRRNGALTDVDELWLALSPDGRHLVTTAAVLPEVPPDWTRLFPPPRFRPDSAGVHPVEPGHTIVKQYVLVDLKSGAAKPLVGGPNIFSVGLGGFIINPVWSADGQRVIVTDTFVKSKRGEPSSLCIALYDLRTDSSRCIIMPKYGYTQNTDPVDDYHRAVDYVSEVHFVPNDNTRVLATYAGAGVAERTTEYQETPAGPWLAIGETLGQGEKKGPGGLELKVTAGVNDPPLLVAANKETSRVLWDPNPQLKDLELIKASIYKWKDNQGRPYQGGLYKPAGYQPGHRYPVVIQTHGFEEGIFRPSGAFPSGFAAQELAAGGIMVLQTLKRDPQFKYQDCDGNTPNEPICDGESIESSVRQLIADGLADPDRIGVIGFSRTCYTVVDMLTKNRVRFKAASITDGVMMDYLQYLFFPSDEPEMIFGAKPFGEGLQQWLKHSPGFNFDKVQTPLLVNALNGPAGALVMYSPYAQLQRLKKPVDLMVIKVYEHVLSNPGARMASQGGAVDWFRFWLKGEEDPDPAKAEQYKRWRELRKLQEENEKKSAAASLVRQR